MSASLRCVLVGLIWGLTIASSGAVAPPRGGDPPLPEGAIARLGSERWRLPANTSSPVMSADGRWIAISRYQSSGITLIDSTTGQLRRILRHIPSVDTLAFTPDSKGLVVRGEKENSSLSVCDLKGRLLPSIHVPLDEHVSLAFSRSRPLLAVNKENFGNETAHVFVCSLESGKQVTRVTPLANQGLRASLSADGKFLATWGTRHTSSSAFTEGDPRIAGTAQVWDVATGKEVGRVVTSVRHILTGTFAPDAGTLVLGHGSTIEFWDWRAARLRRRIVCNPNIRELVLSPDGKLLVALLFDGVQVWGLQPLRRMQVPACPCVPATVSFSGSETILACGSAGQGIFLWDLLTGKVIHQPQGHQFSIVSLAYTQADRLRSLDSGGQLMDWDRTGKLISRWSPGKRSDHWLERDRPTLLSPRGRHVLTTGEHGISVFKARSEERILSVGVSTYDRTCVAISADESLVAAVDHDLDGRARVQVVRRDSGEALTTIVTDRRGVSAGAFSPSGKRVAFTVGREWPRDSQGREQHPFDVHVYDCQTGKLAGGFTPFRRVGLGGTILQFSDDDRLLLASEHFGSLFVLDAQSGKLLQTLDMERPEASPAVFSPGGTLMAVANCGEDRQRYFLELWETSTGKRLHAFPESLHRVTALAFAPDGKRLAAGYENGLGILWDISGQSTGRPVTYTADDLRQLWRDLASGDGGPAFQAMRDLARSERQAVALLRKQLRPWVQKVPTAAELAGLIAKLDEDDIDVRMEAHAALEEMGKAAEKALRDALAGKPSPETKRRLQQLLDQPHRPIMPSNQVRALRAVEVLAWIGTADARAVLQALTRGDRDAPLTRAARSALRRLDASRAATGGEP